MIEAALPVLRLILGLAGLLGLGYACTAWLLPGAGRLERLAWSFGPGALLVTWWLLALSAFRMPFLLPLVVGPPFALVAGLWLGSWLGNRRRPCPAPSPAPAVSPFSPWEWLGLGLLTALLAFALLRAGLYPMWAWDAISTWGFKAKVFYLRGSVDLAGFEAHNYYPNLVPLLLTYLYLWLGEVNDHLVKLVFPGVGAALLLMLYALGRRLGLSRLAALGMVCFLALNGLTFITHLHIAYADLVLTYYALGAFGLIYLWLKEAAPPRAPALAALFLAGLPWVKFEGAPLGGTILLAAALTLLWLRPAPWRPRLLTLFGLGLALVAGALPWRLYALAHGIETGSDHILGFYPHQLALALPSFLWGLVNPALFGLLWPAGVLALVGLRRRLLTTPLLFPALFLSGNFLAILLAYALAPTSVAEFPLYVRATLDRLLLHLAPMAALVVGEAAAACWTREESRQPQPSPPLSSPGRL